MAVAKEKVFFRAVSGLLSKCTRTTNDAVLLHLLHSMCKPILLYASQCICTTRSDVITVTKAWNQIFYKLLKVNNQDCIDDIHMYFGITSVSDEMSIRQNLFMRSLARSDNLILKFLHSVCA